MAGRGDHQVPLLPHQPGAREEQAGEHRARLLPRGQQTSHSVSCNLHIVGERISKVLTFQAITAVLVRLVCLILVTYLTFDLFMARLT